MQELPFLQTRRDLLAALSPIRTSGNPSPADDDGPRVQPSAGNTIRLSTRAMACDFSLIMNPGPIEQIEAAGEMLTLVHTIEAWMSIYRESSEFSIVNRLAAAEPVPVRRGLFELLKIACGIHETTDGAFDLATGALTRLWRTCRSQQRIPEQAEIDAALFQSGMEHLELLDELQRVSFRRQGILLDPGAIGKGYALDECCEWLSRTDQAPRSFLLHGGHSSLIGRGPHNGHSGWPVGIGNPLFTEKRLGTLLLRDRAMGTSGSNIQFFRHQGRRYGHILDPRTGWPIEGMLSVTVLAPTAALADALSTAFFVMGVEKARLCCENWPGVGAILLPFPEQGTRVQPTVVGIPPEWIVWDEDQVILH